MSARLFARRSRLLSAITLAAATGAAVLAPATAFAATPSPASSAPAATPSAPAGTKPLTAKLLAPSKITPLTRGGSTESMTLTVTNNSDQAQPFHPEVLVTPTGPALTMDDPYSFGAQALDAPPTWGLATWSESQSGGWVLPDHGMPSRQFTVPAHQTYTWSVSVGATDSLAAADSALTFSLANDADNSTNLGSVTIPVAPSTNPDPAGSTTGQGSSAAKPAGAAVPAAVVTPVAGAPVATTLASDTTPAAHNLAFTGGGSNALPLVGAGGAMVVLGAGAILYSRRRRAAAQS